MILVGEEKKTTAQPETAAAQQPAQQTAHQNDVSAPSTQISQPKVQTQTQTSTAYNNAMETLKTAETSAPSFSSTYDEQINDIYSKIVGREPFKYDYSSDPVYGQYRESYTQQGKQAMRDTMGQAAALTGGYGSSYGQAVGQQEFDAYLQRLNDVLPELYGAAYDRYTDEGTQLTQQLSLASALRDTEYQQYRDDKADQQYDDAWNLQQAELLANYGDFSKFGELYGDDTANKMRLTWAASNPVAAYAAGTITPDEYYQLTGTYPIGYAVPGAAAAAGDSGGGYVQDYDNEGLSRAQVKAIQSQLNAAGANLVVDGLYGAKTAAAYEQYKDLL